VTGRQHRLILASLTGVLVLETCVGPSQPIATAPGTTTSTTSLMGSGFHVSGNRILDPAGRPFTVKGADAVYGRFAGGDANGLGRMNYQHAERDLDGLQAAGFNLVRLSISADAAHLPPSSPDYIPYGQYLDELDRVVTLVTQRGMVAELSQGETAAPARITALLMVLASRYGPNPLVWIKPDNEPNCEGGDQSKCTDWALWQYQQSGYVRTLRGAGYTRPIVVNCIGWSWDCSQIPEFPLGDANLIYGAHRYGAGATTWDASQGAEADRLWGDLARSVPVIVDEVGTQNPPVSPLTWSQGFLAYVTDWVHHRGGAGCIAFVDAWSDANTMTDPATGRWNRWGQTFIESYVKPVSRT